MLNDIESYCRKWSCNFADYFLTRFRHISVFFVFIHSELINNLLCKTLLCLVIFALLRNCFFMETTEIHAYSADLVFCKIARTRYSRDSSQER